VNPNTGLILFYFLLGLVVFILLFFLLHRRKYPHADSNIVLISSISIASLITSLIFIESCYGSDPPYDTLAILGVLLEFILNVLIVIHVFRKEISVNAEFHHWNLDNYPVLAFAALISGLCLDNIAIIRSKLFHSKSFSAPLRSGFIVAIEAWGTIPLVIGRTLLIIAQCKFVWFGSSTIAQWKALLSFCITLILLSYACCTKMVAIIVHRTQHASTATAVELQTEPPKTELENETATSSTPRLLSPSKDTRSSLSLSPSTN